MKILSSKIILINAILLSGITLTCSGCGSNNSSDTPTGVQVSDYIDAVNSGGETTEFSELINRISFDVPATNLTDSALDQHIRGDGEFERQFTRAISQQFPTIDGLGPVQNNNACIECHNRDGRGNYSIQALTSAPGEWTKLGANEAIFLRISIEPDESCVPDAGNCYCEPIAVPGFSTQLFHRGVLGARPDSPFSGQADVFVKFNESEVTYDDGDKITLRKPVFEIRNPYDSIGEAPGNSSVSRLLQADIKTSPRMGLPVFGLGLLEAISEKDILALADPNDSDGDGISGRANFVCDPVKRNILSDPEPKSLGRFGWKANSPTVAIQGAGAYRGDMGITNYFFPEESIPGTSLHDAYLSTNPDDNGQNGTEVGEDVVQDIMFYTNTLAVPARRNVDNADARKGAELFNTAGCTLCHTPVFTTGTHPGIPGPDGSVAVEIPEVENQLISPFTDMLLHDMGEGLADGRTDFSATGSEWKTRPLWGIGLTKTVNALAGFLHDSRANTLEEAILWHGGEAEVAKERFRTMEKADRNALVAFLKSL